MSEQTPLPPLTPDPRMVTIAARALLHQHNATNPFNAHVCPACGDVFNLLREIDRVDYRAHCESCVPLRQRVATALPIRERKTDNDE